MVIDRIASEANGGEKRSGWRGWDTKLGFGFEEMNLKNDGDAQRKPWSVRCFHYLTAAERRSVLFGLPGAGIASDESYRIAA